MKKLFIIPVLCLFVLSACKKNEEMYSCNPEVNKKATIHKTRNQSISRYELSHLSDLEYQMAVFISLSPENKIRIFKEKIHAELQNTYLSLAEKEILQELITYIKPAHYTDRKDEFQQYANEKEQLLRTNYGWDDGKVYVFTNTWILASEIDEILGKPGTGGQAVGNNCYCFYSYYCDLRSGFNGSSCVESDCIKSNAGCGVFGTTNCSGKCN